MVYPKIQNITGLMSWFTLANNLSVCFSSRMYDKLGYQWATALLGFLILFMVPLPFLFEKYGARIRASSKFTNPHSEQTQPEP